MVKVNQSPAVSIILPTYNRAKTLPIALESVLNQTYPDFELLVVDDGSEDGSREIVSNLHDNRVRYILNTKNMGTAISRNIGIRMSRGRYIAFQDSDDQWLPEKLETQIRTFESEFSLDPEIGVVYSSFWLRHQSRLKLMPPSSPPNHLPIHHDLLAGNFITTQAALVRKVCFQECGMFDPTLPCLLDWDLWLRISRRFHFRSIDQALVIVQKTAGSISRNPARLAIAFELILKKYNPSFRENQQLMANHWYTIGNLYILSGDHRKGQAYLRKAKMLSPARLRFQIAYLFALLGNSFYRTLFKVKHRIHTGWI